MAIDTALVRASATYTIDADAEVTEGETIVVAGKTYTFNATLGSSDGDVDLGADAAGHRANLVAAINLDPAGSGTQYAAAMTRNPGVFAREVGSTVVVYAHVPGSIGNTIPVTVGTSAATLSGATLANGTGNIGDFFDGLFALNQLNSEVIAALRAFSVVEGGLLD